MFLGDDPRYPAVISRGDLIARNATVSGTPARTGPLADPRWEGFRGGGRARLLAGLSYHHRVGLAEHERCYGPLPAGGRRLIDVADASGLTGRGGAGFPAGRKMRTVAARRGRKVVVANGAEGEPASSKDRLLLTRLPHLVLDGIAAAAAAIGADEAHLCVHSRETQLIAGLRAAVAERERHDPVPVQVTGIPGRYVSSEQSSIVQYLNGGEGKPTFAPPRPHERGVRGLPTLVNNVETLAHVALIARHGDRWFRSAGLPAAPGTTLVTVSGAVGRPGVYEIELGTPLGEVIALAGGAAERLAALLVGGYFGAWLRAETAWPVPMTHAALRAAGGALGAGVVIALPESSCLLAETARVVRYLADEGAGQCGPCVFGLPALADALSELAFHGGRGNARERIAALLPLVEGRGACRHPDGVTQLIRSALSAADADARWHDAAGPCHGVRRAPLLPLPGHADPGEYA
jgi:NADH:ubiquinone oxidoreductase subunit F (NADH-binding)